MSKLCYLLTDVAATEKAVTELRALNITDEQLHVIANDKVELSDLPTAAIDEESDVLPAAARGTVLGGATGVLAGVAAAVFPPAGLTLGGGALLLGALGGASVGTLAGTLIGVSVPNSQLQDYQERIDNGDILLLIDVEDDMDGSVQQLMSGFSHEVIDFGEKDTIPPIA